GDIVRAAQRLPRPVTRRVHRRGPWRRVLFQRDAMTDTLQRLSNADLSALAAALRSGRLAAPFSEVAVRRYCAADISSEIASEFDRLATQGIQSKHLALLLET